MVYEATVWRDGQPPALEAANLNKIEQGIVGAEEAIDALPKPGQWEQAATWAALPSTGNWPGRRMHVLDGLGLCLAVWDGAGWRVDGQSDTGVLNVQAVNGWTGQLRLRRAGEAVHMASTGLDRSAATSDTFYTSPVGFRPLVNTVGAAEDGSFATGIALLRSAGTNDLRRSKWVSPGTSIWFSAAFATADPWPTTPPA